MSLQYEGLNCPKLEASLKNGARLGIFRDGDTAMLSRVQNDSGLITSKVSNSLCVLLQETDWALEKNHLRAKPIWASILERTALENLLARGFFLGFDAKENVLNGYLIDPNENILCIKKTKKGISNLLQILELEAIKYL